MLAVLAFAGHRFQTPWWDHTPEIAKLEQSIWDSSGYEGTDEYIPVDADGYEISHEARRVTFKGQGADQIHVLEWGPESKLFTAQVSSSGQLVLRLFNYPAWRVEVNGRVVTAASLDVTGQMTIPVKAGENQVRITFSRTRDRTIGGTGVRRERAFDRRSRSISAEAAASSEIGLREGRRPTMKRILIATSNAGKLVDFAAAARPHGIEIIPLPNFSSLPPVVEDGLTFEANARKKAEAYSHYAPGEIVLADDSGLEVDALGGAPGVHSARYAADAPHLVENNTDDHANNARLLRELRNVPAERRTGTIRMCDRRRARGADARGV